MKSLIPTQRIFVTEFCKEHLGRTDHEIKFLDYDPIRHTVTFYYYCIMCLRETGQVQSYQVTINAEDWLYFMTFYEDSTEDN